MTDPFENIVTNEDIAAVADAIREVVSVPEGMTILEMPEKIRLAKLIEVDAGSFTDTDGATRIQIKRGLLADMPILAEGELAYCIDTKELYIGTVEGVNVKQGANIEALVGLIESKVAKTTMVNGKELSTDIEIGVGDIAGLETTISSKADKTYVDTRDELKVNTSDVVDNLASTDVDKPLSANQGKVLKDTVDLLDTRVEDLELEAERLDDEVLRVEQKADDHIEDVDNPHGVTAEQVDTYVKTTIDSKDANTLQGAKDYTDILGEDVLELQGKVEVAEDKIEGIEDGTTVVKKAEQDASGNVIASTYETKIDATSKLANKVDKTTKVIGLDLQDDILLNEFKTALGNATQSVAGLLSAEDKTHLDGLVALLENDDDNTIVDTIGEILAIFNNYPEGADLVTALSGKVDKVAGKGLSTNDLTDILKSNYDTAYSWGNHAVEGYLKAITKAMVEAVLTGTITSHSHTKAQVGLSNVDNTSDLDKPISTAQQTALDGKVDKVEGKGLSENDYTDTEKNKLSGIQAGAEVNEVNSVNGQTGVVELDAEDVGALPDSTPIPAKVSDLDNDEGFVKGSDLDNKLALKADKTYVDSQDALKVDKNNAITAGTKTKITYDSKGLVTAGDDLAEDDIPALPASKITQSTTARFVTDAEKATWNGKQNALTAGDGISISGNVISASGGGGSGLTVEEWNTATKFLALSDANKMFKCSHTANQTVSIPTHSMGAFPIGTMITFLLTGTNAVTFSGAWGVTLTSIDSLVELKTQYGMASLIKTDKETWQLVGALE